MFEARQKRKRSSLRTRAPFAAELLEVRTAPAAFGMPWADPRSLSVSFPTDNATIGPYSNSLREVLDQVTDRKVWQEAVLRAFQTWSVHANINIGLTPDRGDHFGTIGLASNDPRFGEFRIGAFPQPGVLASASPFQPNAGTWSGDIFVNTQINWFLADWNSTSAITVPAPDQQGPAYELFSVLLHEAGNALGLPDTRVSGSVMFETYEGPKGSLTPSDIRSIRTLYGNRTDPFEQTSNNSRLAATRIRNPTGYTGETPIRVQGSLHTRNDQDFYRFRPIRGQEKMAIRLNAAGISLVKARIEVLNARGEKIADAKADSIFENNLEVEIGSLNPSTDYFIRVSPNTSDVFAIGDYEIVLDYRDSSQRPPLKPATHDADAVDEDDQPIAYVDIDSLFSNGLVDAESNPNNTLTTAQQLTTSPGFLVGTRFEAISSLNYAGDRDLFRFTVPTGTPGVLNLNVAPLGFEKADLEVFVFNAQGDRVAAREIVQAAGARSLIIDNPVPGGTYVVGVRASAGASVTTGNYIVTADVATDPAEVSEVFSGSVSGNAADFSNFTTYKSQLFRFDLSAFGGNNSQGVQLTFIDQRTRNIALTISVANGASTTEYVWLPKGDYLIMADLRTRTGGSTTPIGFRLLADVLSDDQGPNPVDPTNILSPPAPPWRWTPPPTSQPPVIDLPFVVVEDPWLEESYIEFVPNYYTLFFG